MRERASTLTLALSLSDLAEGEGVVFDSLVPKGVIGVRLIFAVGRGLVPRRGPLSPNTLDPENR